VRRLVSADVADAMLVHGEVWFSVVPEETTGGERRAAGEGRDQKRNFLMIGLF
jgi:hypothetical protein